MGLFKAFAGAVKGTFADQWKEVITAGPFDELTAVAPGVMILANNGRGVNRRGSVGVISAGSKIFVPEHTAMVIFDQGGIEEVVVAPGGYVYDNGEATVFDDGGVDTLLDSVADRFEFGGQPSELKHVAFVNLRELRGIKFGTRGPMPYHDKFYDVDLEVMAYGKFSLRIDDPAKFVRNFLPPNVISYSFADLATREQVVAEFLQDFNVALNALSEQFRISQLPAQGAALASVLKQQQAQAGSWSQRFGMVVESVGIESIQFSEASRELVRQYSAKRLDVTSYEGVSKHAADIAAQQKIAAGIQHKGLGDGAGLLVGLNVASQITGHQQADISEQIALVTKLKSLLDAGILTAAEFEAKKREIMGL